jgi:predicted  nucleic acid-binding Zn-ribbon protein
VSDAENPSIATRRIAAYQVRLDLVERTSLDAAHDAQVARVQTKALEVQLKSLADRVTRLVLDSAERAARDSANLAEIRKLAEGLVKTVEERNRQIVEILTGLVAR